MDCQRYIVLGLLFFFVITISCENSVDLYHLEGKVSLPKKEQRDWFSKAKVLIDGGQYLGFIRKDGSFVVNNVPSGSHVVEVANSDYNFEPVRVEITSKGKIRAIEMDLIKSKPTLTVNYPLRFNSKSKFNYFQSREQLTIINLLTNPMVLMMILPLLLIVVMPRLMNAADPDTQREMQETMENTNLSNLPDVSEMLASIGWGKKKEDVKDKDSNTVDKQKKNRTKS